MVEIKFNTDESYYIIDETLKKYNKLGEQFSIKDAAEILTNAERIFNREKFLEYKF
jgi:hypothetical protein